MRLDERLDVEFCQRALNAVRVAAERQGKFDEQVIVHVTLSRGKMGLFFKQNQHLYLQKSKFGYMLYFRFFLPKCN